MNKGRNILLLMIVMLGISILSFFTLFERSNTTGVVDGVRYVVVSEQDGIKTFEFYFKEKGRVEKGEAVDGEDAVVFRIEGVDYEYTVTKDTWEVTAKPTGEEQEGGPFNTYSEELFRTMVKGKEKFMKFWQAIVVGVICLAGGLVILFAEEIWHIIKKKGPDEVPAWKDMNGIKWAGGGIIAVGVVIMIVFILV